MPSSFHDITDHGAIGDGTTLCTAALQAAIDLVAAARGGTVHVPAGTWLTGTVELKNGVTLDLHPAARLLGSPRLEDYREVSWGQHIDRTPWHLLVAREAHDITITGGGTIDGNGPSFWEPTMGGDPLTTVVAREADPEQAALLWIKAHKEHRPSPMIEITGCTNVRIRDITIANSAGWNLHLHNSSFIWITGVRLAANLRGPNNDGFDITGCTDVMISGCHLSCCDDAIVLKTTPDSGPVERVTVTGCVLRTRCVALKLGAAESFHDMRQIVFSDCVVYESQRAVGLYNLEGATYEDIVVSNIVCDTRTPQIANRPIHLQLGRRTPTSKLGIIRNVQITNLIARTDGRIILTADPGAKLEHIHLRNIQLTCPTVDDPQLDRRGHASLQWSPQNPAARAARAAIVAENIDDLVVEGVSITWPQLDDAGHEIVPEAWRTPYKSQGGIWTLLTSEQWTDGTTPPFAVVWARNVTGGLLDNPLAQSARQGVERYDLDGCDLIVRG